MLKFNSCTCSCTILLTVLRIVNCCLFSTVLRALQRLQKDDDSQPQPTVTRVAAQLNQSFFNILISEHRAMVRLDVVDLDLGVLSAVSQLKIYLHSCSTPDCNLHILHQNDRTSNFEPRVGHSKKKGYEVRDAKRRGYGKELGRRCLRGRRIAQVTED